MAIRFIGHIGNNAHRRPAKLAACLFVNVCAALIVSSVCCAEPAARKDPEQIFRESGALPFYEKAERYVKIGKCDKAIDQYLKAIELSPGYYRIYTRLGYAYFYAGRFEEALNSLRKAVSLKSDDVETLRGLGSIYMGMGQENEAAVYFEKSILIDPSSEAAPYLALAVIYNHKGRYEEAVPLIEKVIKQSPRLDAAYFALADAYYHLGRMDEAADRYEKGVVLNENLAEPHLRLAEIYELRHKYNRALKYALRARQLEPGNAQARALVMRIHMQIKSDIRAARKKTAAQPPKASAPAAPSVRTPETVGNSR